MQRWLKVVLGIAQLHILGHRLKRCERRIKQLQLIVTVYTKEMNARIDRLAASGQSDQIGELIINIQQQHRKFRSEIRDVMLKVRAIDARIDQLKIERLNNTMNA